MLTQFKKLSLFFTLLSVFSMTARVRSRFGEQRYNSVQEHSGVTVEMTELNNKDREGMFGSFFTNKLNKKKIVPMRVKVKNTSTETVTLAKKSIGLPHLEHGQLMARLRNADKWNRYAIEVLTPTFGIMSASFLVPAIYFFILGLVQRWTFFIVIAAILGVYALVPLGITGACGRYWYKLAHAFDQYDAYNQISWYRGAITVKPGQEREEIVFVDKEAFEDPYQVQVTSTGQATRTYDMHLEKTRV